jgi:hypothetical protein
MAWLARVDSESLLTPALSPLEKGGEGTGVGGSTLLAAFAWQGARLMLVPFAWSLMGALHIVGLLAETPFLIKADQFAGVKLAHALPLLLVLVFYTAWVVGRWDFWREWLTHPVLWGQALLALVVLGAVGLMLIRTGNETPGAAGERHAGAPAHEGVSDWASCAGGRRVAAADRAHSLPAAYDVSGDDWAGLGREHLLPPAQSVACLAPTHGLEHPAWNRAGAACAGAA